MTELGFVTVVVASGGRTVAAVAELIEEDARARTIRLQGIGMHSGDRVAVSCAANGFGGEDTWRLGRVVDSSVAGTVRIRLIDGPSRA